MTSRIKLLFLFVVLDLGVCRNWKTRRERRSSVDKTVFFSPILAWAPSNSHVDVEFEVVTVPTSTSISYYLQCATLKPNWDEYHSFLYDYEDEFTYTNTSIYGVVEPEELGDASKEVGVHYACSRMFDPAAADVCDLFRAVFIIRIHDGDVWFELPEFSRSCGDEEIYAADCSFDEEESCEYRNDACGFVQWKIDDGAANNEDVPLLKKKTSTACETLLDVVALQSSGFKAVSVSGGGGGTGKKKRSSASADGRRLRRAAADFALFLNPRNVEKGLIVTGMFNTPTLTYHITLNRAMSFSYYFYARGVHQIVVSMRCVSKAMRYIRLRGSLNYSVKNFKVQTYDQSGRKCLHLHAYLSGCRLFQVQFVGGARGSKLAIDDVLFQSACSKYDNI